MYEGRIRESDLLFQIKLLRDRVNEFESGDKYLRMKEDHRLARSADMHKIRRLEKDLERSRKETIHNRELWFDTCQDVIKGCEKRLADKDKEVETLWRQASAAEERYQQECASHRETKAELEAVRKQLEEEREKNRSLSGRLGKDYHNSSKSSSMSPNHKTIHNSRVKSGRKPGGQKGHLHHGRKVQRPTKIVEIPVPEKYIKDENYEPTGKTIRKQLIQLRIVTDVIEYVTQEFRDRRTGQRVHAEFPEGLVDDVTYGGSVKATAYLLNNHLYTSIDKTRRFLKDISQGRIDISNGFICNLSKQFSKYTEEERDKIFDELAAASILHADFTFARQSGKQAAVMITTSADRVLYQGREKKGDEGVKGSPLEFYEGTTITDHETSLLKHGSRHQECLAHVKRYAMGAAENDPEKKWSSKLIAWISDSIGYWNRTRDGEETFDENKTNEYIEELRKILDLAKEEYEKAPPSRYNKDGYNLFKRMYEHIDDYTLFLREPSVEPTNNDAERAGRKIKRKAHQVMSFRSLDGLKHFCDGLTILESIIADEENLFEGVASRFDQARKS